MWASDDGGLLVGCHTAELATVDTAAQPRTVLSNTEMAIAVRLAPNGSLLYIAAGPCTDLFLAMFEHVPWFWRDTTTPREARRCIRELTRDVQGFATSDGLECIPEFFHTYAFPVELVSDEEEDDDNNV